MPASHLRLVGSDRVPVEWIGRARLLRDKITAAHALTEAATEKLIAPFRPRPGFVPMPRRVMLERLLRRYRAQQSAARLRLISKFEDGKLQIIELHAEPTRIRFPGWAEDEELAVAVTMRTLAIRPPVFAERIMPVALVGLHALARRYERGDDRDDLAVLHDLEALGRAWRDTVAGPIEFAIPPPGGGRWIGAQHTLEDTVVLAVRTFYDD